MLKKILGVLFPFTMWSRSNSNLKNIHIFISSIISIWFYGSLIIFIFIITSYEKTKYKKFTFYYQKTSNTIEKNYLQLEAKRQYNFLNKDPLRQKIPTTKILYINNKLSFSWLLGPVYILNLINNVEARAITPIGLDIIFLNYGLKKHANNLEKDLYLSHELVHILQHEKYGYFSTRLRTPAWVSEGYPTYRMAEYGSKRIDSLKIPNFYANGGNLVKFALKNQKRSTGELHFGDIGYEKLLSSFCEKYTKYWGCK